MKGVKGFLLVLLGMVLGIVLLVGGLAAAIYGVSVSVTVGELQNTVNIDVIDDSVNFYNQTLFDAIKTIIGDVKNPQSVSLESLYEKYGVKVLNGIGGIDFTQKEFYSKPITELIANPQIIAESLTLNDLSVVSGIDFEEYGLPILTENLNNSVVVAIDNVLSSLDGDLTARLISTKFGIDIGVDNNVIIKSLQDVSLSSFGNVINAMYVGTLMNADTDVFIPRGQNAVFTQVDVYEAVSPEDLRNKNYEAPLGVEKYVADAIDRDGNGTADALVERELRYVKKAGSEPDTFVYVVDNSCYNDNFDFDSNEVEFYRHIQYAEYDSAYSKAQANPQYFVRAYANRVLSVSPSGIVLLDDGFFSLANVLALDSGLDLVPLQELVNSNSINIDVAYLPSFEACEKYTLTDATPNTDSKLHPFVADNPYFTDTPIYLRVHAGTSHPTLQVIAHMTIAELQNNGDFFDNLAIGDVITVDESSSLIMKSLVNRGCLIKDLATIVDDLKIDEVIEINEESALIMKSLAARGFTISDLSTAMNDLTLGEVMEINGDEYSAPVDASFVASHPEYTYFVYDEDLTLYRRWEESDGEDVNRYIVIKEGTDSTIIKRLATCTVGNLSNAMTSLLDDIRIDEIMDINAHSAVSISGDQTIPTPGDDVSGLRYLIRALETDENGNSITYAYDDKGKYMLRNYRLVETPLEDMSQYVVSSAQYKYQEITNLADFQEAATTFNVFYKDNDDYIFNLSLCAYTVAQNPLVFPTGKIYKRAYTDTGDVNVHYATVFDNSSGNIYVNIKGNYIPYDSTNIAHYSMKNYYIRKDGKSFVSITAKGVAGDDAYEYKKGEDLLFSKYYCDTVYIADVNGDFVYTNGKYIAYDASVHDGVDESGQRIFKRYSQEMGYIAQFTECFYLTSGGTEYESDFISHFPGILSKIEVEREQSVSILCYFANQNSTVSNINDSLENAKIKDILNVDPNSLLSRYRENTLSSLSKQIEQDFMEITLGELVEYTSITNMDPAVVSALSDVTLRAFFESLTYSPSKGIYVDMEKALLAAEHNG